MYVVGRRSAVVAAAAGLVVSSFGAPASAAPSSESASSALPAVDTSSLTASARAVLATAPVVTVAPGATWGFDVPAVTVVADPPPPPPVVKKKVVAASRAATRTAVAANEAAVAPAPAVEAPAGANVPQSVAGNAILEVAARYVGVAYRWGGTTPDGFDCSGFTSYVYAQLGVSLPRTAEAQSAAGTVVSRADAQPGDLIVSPGHIGIYAGGDTQIDSPRPGKTIQFRAIWQTSPTFIRFG